MRRMLPLVLLLCAQAAPAEDWLYLTYPGDTPLKIGRDYLNKPSDWDKVLKLNKVKNEYVLPVHTRIRIPVELLKVTPAPVTVSHVEGNVRVKPDGGTFRPLAVGDKLTGGETVLTGPRSFAGFVLADGSKLTQQASSKLSFGRLAAYGKTGMVATELDLENGRIEAGASKQIGPAGGFKVRTPVAVAGLRGTAFRLNVSDDGKVLRNEVLEGIVGIDAQDREVQVKAAEGTVTEQGKAPEAPRPLLPAPSAQGIPTHLVALPLNFAWPGMPDAKGWRAQVAADPGFQKILLDSEGSQPSAQWEAAPPDGHYFLRIRAVDTAGLEGLNTDLAFDLDARPLPPQALAPKADERSYQEQVTFSWAAAPEAQGYVLQIAPNGDFAPGQTVERRLEAVLSATEKLAPGQYEWRLASLDESGQAHGWGAARGVRVQPLPNPPKADTRTENGQAEFAWSAAGAAASYDVEIARRADFASLEGKLHVTETKAAASLKPGRYHWRIRALEADGQAGPWSRPAALVMPPEAPGDIRVNVSIGVLSITWQGNAPAYRLEFARDANFEVPLFNHREEVTHTRLATPEPGQYWVRVIALSETGSRGGQSKPVSFTIDRWQ
ncbi:FecR domain-containing protein [Parasulfuritortus cantonensis]|nr:FecR domain-containing protein [Parasulfuritortus cantonensis]